MERNSKAKIIKIRKALIYAFLLFLIIGNIFPLIVNADNNFTLSPQKGTTYLNVNTYDENMWDSIVNQSFGPEKWFLGNFSGTDIKSKYVVRGWFDGVQWNTSQAMSNLLVPQENYSVWLGLSSIGYNKTYINERYGNYTYELSVVSRSKWNFTSQDLSVNASYPNDFIIIFENASDYKRLFDNYNDLIDNINTNKTAKFLSLNNLTKYEAEEYFWHMIINNKMGILEPHNTYLDQLITDLRLNDTKVTDGILEITRSVNDNFTIEIQYGQNAVISHFTAKDEEDNIFFEIESSTTQDSIYVIITLISASLLGIIVITMYKRKIRRDRYKEKLETYKNN